MDKPALLAQAVDLEDSLSHQDKATLFSAIAQDLAPPSLPRRLQRLEQLREVCLVTKPMPQVRASSAALPQQLHSRRQVFLELRLEEELGLEISLVLEDLAQVALEFLGLLRQHQSHLSHLVRRPHPGVDLEQEEEGLVRVLRLPQEEASSEATQISRLSDRSQRPLPLTYSGEILSRRLLVDLELAPEPVSQKLAQGYSVVLLLLREVILLGVQLRQVQLPAVSAPTTTTTKRPVQASSVKGQRLLARLRCSQGRLARLTPPIRHSLALDLEITITNHNKVLPTFLETTISSKQHRPCLVILPEAATVICLEVEITAALSSTTREQITIRTKQDKVSSQILPTTIITVFSVARSKMCSRLRNR